MAIKTEFLKDVDKYWTVTTTKKAGFFGETMSLGVVAKTASDAIIKVLESYPDTKVTACNYKGAVDLA
jgi:hypothetical protein